MAEPAPLIRELQQIKEESDRFVALYKELTKNFALAAKCHDEICIYLVGSFARGEGVPPPEPPPPGEADALAPQSDIDLFFVAAPDSKITREQEITLFSRFIALHREKRYKMFSRDCAFLKIHRFDDMWEVMGAPADDSRNTFTARMLLLLEGVNLHNQRVYDHLIETTIKQYFNDYWFNEDEFVPQFLTNDITRYWKTLCLNYEAFRDKTDQFKTREDNLKLRFSRKLLCFSTVVGLLELVRAGREKKTGVSAGSVKAIVTKKPLERLAVACSRTAELRDRFSALQIEYAKFLEWTRQCKVDGAHSVLKDEVWAEVKASSTTFNSALFDILSLVGGDSGLKRVTL